MRGILFLVMLIILGSVSVSAQRFNGGIQAGIAGSQVDGNQLSGYNKAGLFGGVFTSYSLAKSISLQLELNYIEKGSRENPTENNNFSEFKIKLNYIEIPLLFRYTLPNKFRKAGIDLGFSYGRLLTQNQESFPVQKTISFLPSDLSLLAGLSYRISERFQMNLRAGHTFWGTPVAYFDSSHIGWLIFRGYDNSTAVLSLLYYIKK